MLYQRVNVATSQLVGGAAALPAAVSGLSDDVLADLDAAFDAATLAQLGLTGAGFLPEPEPEPEPEPPVRELTRIAFMQRMAPATRIGIRVRGKQDPIVEDFLDLLASTDLISLDAPDTIMGVGYMQSVGLLTAGEAAALLA